MKDGQRRYVPLPKKRFKRQPTAWHINSLIYDADMFQVLLHHPEFYNKDSKSKVQLALERLVTPGGGKKPKIVLSKVI